MFIKLITHIIVTVIFACIAYGLFTEIGQYFIDQQMSSGGLVMARDIISARFAGISGVAAVLLTSLYAWDFDKKNK